MVFHVQTSVGILDWSINKDLLDTAKRSVKYGPEFSDADSLLATLMAKNRKEFPEYSEAELFKVAKKYAIYALDLKSNKYY